MKTQKIAYSIVLSAALASVTLSLNAQASNLDEIRQRQSQICQSISADPVLQPMSPAETQQMKAMCDIDAKPLSVAKAALGFADLVWDRKESLPNPLTSRKALKLNQIVGSVAMFSSNVAALVIAE